MYEGTEVLIELTRQVQGERVQVHLRRAIFNHTR
jgi:hypothetical protein